MKGQLNLNFLINKSWLINTKDRRQSVLPSITHRQEVVMVGYGFPLARKDRHQPANTAPNS